MLTKVIVHVLARAYTKTEMNNVSVLSKAHGGTFFGSRAMVFLSEGLDYATGFALYIAINVKAFCNPSRVRIRNFQKRFYNRNKVKFEISRHVGDKSNIM